MVPKPDVVVNRNDYATIIVIDSQDRNKFLYKNANDYVMHFNSPLSDVIEVELISIDYKYSNYEFDSTNNELHIKHNTDDAYVVKIGKGNYTTSNMVTHFASQYNNFKNISGKSYDITLKYHDIIDRYYFSTNTNDIINVYFKGSEKTYPTTLYGNTTTNTGSYNYKTNTNGKYFGFSEKDFSNKLDISSMSITDNTGGDYTLQLTINNKSDYQQLLDTLNIFDSTMTITFKYSGENVQNVNNSKIKGFEIISDTIISLKLTIDSPVIVNETISSPTFYTNIIIGDTIKTEERDKYVLLDIKELNRLKSTNTNIHDSYVKIPIAQSEQIYFNNTKNYGTVKYFNPILKTLDRLTIKIKDRDGKVLQSGGLDHTMVFAIKCLNNGNNLRTT
tara:strand:+ start:13491 stop:14660 length:1170 start_codon:yes stop_codon:yes gene_type:complete